MLGRAGLLRFGVLLAVTDVDALGRGTGCSGCPSGKSLCRFSNAGRQ